MKKILIIFLLAGILAGAFLQNRFIEDFRDDFTSAAERAKDSVLKDENIDFSDILSVYENVCIHVARDDDKLCFFFKRNLHHSNLSAY